MHSLLSYSLWVNFDRCCILFDRLRSSEGSGGFELSFLVCSFGFPCAVPASFLVCLGDFCRPCVLCITLLRIRQRSKEPVVPQVSSAVDLHQVRLPVVAVF